MSLTEMQVLLKRCFYDYLEKTSLFIDDETTKIIKEKIVILKMFSNVHSLSFVPDSRANH